MKNGVRKRILMMISVLLLISTVMIVLFYNGIIWFNNPPEEAYPVRGIDVSAHQGIINWEKISSQNIDFAFIKATEGGSFSDKMFAQNWEGAFSSGIITGAYHFFSFQSPSEAQAANFISTVPKRQGMLPPVVDIELYGKFERSPMGKSETKEKLDELLDMLYEYYGVRPILYATMRAYKLYLENDYKEHLIWIRNVYYTPALPDKRSWTFWQYSHKGRLDGYAGREKFIDLNVYNGSMDDLMDLCL